MIFMETNWFICKINLINLFLVNLFILPLFKQISWSDAYFKLVYLKNKSNLFVFKNLFILPLFKQINWSDAYLRFKWLFNENNILWIEPISSAGSMGEPNRQSPKSPNEKKPQNFYQ